MITVFFATNRDMSGNTGHRTFGQDFAKQGPGWLRYGWAEVPEALVDNPDEDDLRGIKITLAKEKLARKEEEEDEELGSGKVMEVLRHKMMKHDRDTIVFVHGYANTFRNALRHGAQIKKLYGLTDYNILVFSWPSDGALMPYYLSYYRDRDDAEDSGRAMARAFAKLCDFLKKVEGDPGRECEHRTHVMAHSMGNYALRHALPHIRDRLLEDNITRVFDNAFLFAADEDDDAFDPGVDKMRLLTGMSRQITIYHRANDRALTISDWTKNERERLGAEGPHSMDGLPRKVNVVDCMDVTQTQHDGNRHNAHRYAPEHIFDVRQVLSGKRPEEIPGRTFVAERRSYRLANDPQVLSAAAPADDGKGGRQGGTGRGSGKGGRGRSRRGVGR